MDHIRIRLGDIRPSDLPREEAWSEVQTRIPSASPSNTLVLQDLGIELIKVGDVYTVQNGSHRLARLVQLLGPDFVVEASVTNPAHYREDKWAYQLSRVEDDGIHSFEDFLNEASNRRFLR